MKHLVAAILALTCTLSFAQAAPHAVPQSSRAMPRLSPPKSPSTAPQISNEEVGDLLKAQTTAIQSLAEKIELLNARLATVESKVKK